ncbi:MAG: hypothetical protein LH628_02395, partial [Microcoleus sp. CAN_BIN18]|nr:hypothetical protein [Microcoleus sp. CAN_BIN18]
MTGCSLSYSTTSISSGLPSGMGQILIADFNLKSGANTAGLPLGNAKCRSDLSPTLAIVELIVQNVQ